MAPRVKRSRRAKTKKTMKKNSPMNQPSSLLDHSKDQPSPVGSVEPFESLMADPWMANSFGTAFTQLVEIATRHAEYYDAGPEVLLAQLEVCSLILHVLLDRKPRGYQMMPYVIPVELREEWISFIRQLEHQRTPDVMEYLKSQAMDLRHRIDNGAFSIRDEWRFAKLGRQIAYASGIELYVDEIFDPLDRKFFPRLITGDIQELVQQISNDHVTFQNLVYPDQTLDEEFALWYSIWRSLQEMESYYRDHEGSFSSTVYELEKEFFSHPVTRAAFEWVNAQPEFFCHQVIEDLVADYCGRVDDTLNQDLDVVQTMKELNGLLQSHQDSRDHVTGSSGADLNRELPLATRFLATRLNRLLGQPSVLRRLGEEVHTFLADDLPFKGMWDEVFEEHYNPPELPTNPLKSPTYPRWLPARSGFDETLANEPSVDGGFEEDSPCDDITQEQANDVGTGLPSLADLNKAINSSSPRATLPEHNFLQEGYTTGNGGDSAATDQPSVPASTSGETKAHRYHAPQGRNVISAYDYVHCPVPENRAYEVAHSRLIHRDLRGPGHISEGLQITDLVNLPPPHCRVPGTWTIWKQRIPLGPYEIAKSLVMYAFNNILGRKEQTVRRPLTLPFVTSRSECRNRCSRSLCKQGPLYDKKTRVTKTSTGQRSGLRGGSGLPRHVELFDVSPSPKPRQLNRRAFVDVSASDERSKPDRPRSNTRVQTSEDRDAENKRPLDTRPVPSGNSDAENRRPPVAPSTEGEDTQGERSQHADSPSRSTRRPLHEVPAPRMISRKGAPGPGDGPDVEVIHQQVCHPCPVFEGQYHHVCHEACQGVRMLTEYIGGDPTDEPVLFQGSTWESRESIYYRRNRVTSLEALASRYADSVRDGEARMIFISTGAIIELRRHPGPHLVVEVIQRNDRDWQPFGGNLGPNRAWARQFRTADELPENYLSVDMKTPDEDDYTSIARFPGVRDLDFFLSPRWPNGTRFRFTTNEAPIILRLERLPHDPWERLQIESGNESSSQPNVRDFAAPNPGDVSSAGPQVSGQAAMAQFHQRLRNEKAAQDARKKAAGPSSAGQRVVSGQNEEGDQRAFHPGIFRGNDNDNLNPTNLWRAGANLANNNHQATPINAMQRAQAQVQAPPPPRPSQWIPLSQDDIYIQVSNHTAAVPGTADEGGEEERESDQDNAPQTKTSASASETPAKQATKADIKPPPTKQRKRSAQVNDEGDDNADTIVPKETQSKSQKPITKAPAKKPTTKQASKEAAMRRITKSTAKPTAKEGKGKNTAAADESESEDESDDDDLSDGPINQVGKGKDNDDDDDAPAGAAAAAPTTTNQKKKAGTGGTTGKKRRRPRKRAGQPPAPAPRKGRGRPRKDTGTKAPPATNLKRKRVVEVEDSEDELGSEDANANSTNAPSVPARKRVARGH